MSGINGLQHQRDGLGKALKELLVFRSGGLHFRVGFITYQVIIELGPNEFHSVIWLLMVVRVHKRQVKLT